LSGVPKLSFRHGANRILPIMLMRMFQRTWHGIDLTTLPAAQSAQNKPASAEFYSQFYKALASGMGKIEPGFYENKRKLGEAIEQDAIAVWKGKRQRTPRILALAAGKAPVERVWAERGYDVTFNDCQEESLRELRDEFPNAPFLVGDILQLTPNVAYDLITAITVDYVMTRRELTEFLARSAQWLERDGQIILYCASTLSLRQMLVETLKRARGDYRKIPHVFWGFWRTPAEFRRAAKDAGLIVAGLHGLSGGALGMSHLKPKTGFLRYFPPLRDPHLVVVMEKNFRDR
jgi:cyclopropane fatty-acyl-phospholipid synthase-like methyltransferase